MMKNYPAAYLMCRPAFFGFNSQTSQSNVFQQNSTVTSAEILLLAQQEFDGMVSQLIQAEVNIMLVQDTPNPVKPDAVFPNNWFSTHADGHLFIYPMQAPNRQMEVREDVLQQLEKKFGLTRKVDLRHHISSGKYLEGTGSLVFDHASKKCYASVSNRTHPELVNEVCEVLNYDPVLFYAYHENQLPVYHTNVLLSIGDGFAVLCAEVIRHPELVINALQSSGLEIIIISKQEMNFFSGNVLQIRNRKNEPCIVISDTALQQLHARTKEKMELYGKLIAVKIPIIESVGGGSARCMMAEIFSAYQEK